MASKAAGQGRMQLPSLLRATALLCILSSAARPALAQGDEQEPPSWVDVSADVDDAINALSNLTSVGQGAVVVVLSVSPDGTVTTVAQGAGGWKGHDRDGKANISDIYAVASCSKSFTAATLAAAVTARRVRWTDTIPTILARGGVSRRTLHADWRSVTLAQLLHHRAGFVRDTDFNEMWNMNRALYQDLFTPSANASERRRVRAAFAAYHLSRPRPANLKVGEYAYSNAGIDVASHFAEILFQRDFESLLDSLFFKPLGIEGGTLLPYPLPVPSDYTGMIGQSCSDATGLSNYPRDDWLTSAAFRVGSGGLTMRVGDLANWVAYHIKGLTGLLNATEYKTISHQAFIDLHTPWKAPSAPNGGDYAKGWSNGTSLNRMVHDGSLAGFRTLMMGITDADADGNMMAIATSTNLREDLTNRGDSRNGACAKAVQAVFPDLFEKMIQRFRARPSEPEGEQNASAGLVGVLDVDQAPAVSNGRRDGRVTMQQQQGGVTTWARDAGALGLEAIRATEHLMSPGGIVFSNRQMR